MAGLVASYVAPFSSHAFPSHAFSSDDITFSLATEHRINITEPNTFHQVVLKGRQESVLLLFEAEAFAKLFITEITVVPARAFQW